MHLEVLSGMHESSEKRTAEFEKHMTEFEKRMTEYAADVKDTLRRLGNIAAAHEDRLDDHGDRIEKLES